MRKTPQSKEQETLGGLMKGCTRKATLTGKTLAQALVKSVLKQGKSKE